MEFFIIFKQEGSWINGNPSISFTRAITFRNKIMNKFNIFEL